MLLLEIELLFNITGNFLNIFRSNLYFKYISSNEANTPERLKANIDHPYIKYEEFIS